MLHVPTFLTLLQLICHVGDIVLIKRIHEYSFTLCIADRYSVHTQIL